MNHRDPSGFRSTAPSRGSKCTDITTRDHHAPQARITRCHASISKKINQCILISSSILQEQNNRKHVSEISCCGFFVILHNRDRGLRTSVEVSTQFTGSKHECGELYNLLILFQTSTSSFIYIARK